MQPGPGTLGEFVQQRRTGMGLSQPELAKAAGISSAWFGRLESGSLVGRPKVDTLTKLAPVLGVDLAYLLALAGYPEPAIAALTSRRDVADVKKGSEQASRGEAGGTMEVRGKLSLRWIPLIGQAAAGAPLMWTADDIIGHVAVDADDDADAAYVICGDSVSALGIHDGMRVLVKYFNGSRPEDGMLVVVGVEGSPMCKVFRRLGGVEFLESRRAGQKAEALIFNEDVRLIGEVVDYKVRTKGMRF